MKIIGRITTAILTAVVIGSLGWLVGAGVQGKTLKDTWLEQKQEEVLEDENQNENENQENTENGDEVDSGVETTSIKYKADSNTICLG